ncbi:hypothetical protein NP493_3957g00000 [Ridgeia piscesae]|uniref:EGF-like domain-containing protein n=1 Tax=Ridgeia piscesae TaxID=27915 RepID=A0AAD9J3K7_RIDPI|nr:hypothetical protein NP493_3957g00000 [Ridgeia piscesae]
MLTYELPKHGNLMVYTPVTDVSVIDQDCSQMWSTRQSLWDHVIDDISHNVSLQTVSLPNPCDTQLVGRHLTWAVTLLRYTPFEGYIGQDTMKIVATDGQVHNLVTINLHILRNPCTNNGICKGPETDPECTSTVRSRGFAGYDCECPRGYLGRYCETDINECDSSPCPANYTCINGDGHYECECHTDWPCYVAPSTVQPVALSSESTLQPWHIALITIAACLLLVIITAAVFALKKR